eukprot:6213120-Pleurochrysis_carterae.AAC.4
MQEDYTSTSKCRSALPKQVKSARRLGHVASFLHHFTKLTDADANCTHSPGRLVYLLSAPSSGSTHTLFSSYPRFLVPSNSCPVQNWAGRRQHPLPLNRRWKYGVLERKGGVVLHGFCGGHVGCHRINAVVDGGELGRAIGLHVPRNDVVKCARAIWREEAGLDDSARELERVVEDEELERGRWVETVLQHLRKKVLCVPAGDGVPP